MEEGRKVDDMMKKGKVGQDCRTKERQTGWWKEKRQNGVRNEKEDRMEKKADART
jgi:hypothetical protein